MKESAARQAGAGHEAEARSRRAVGLLCITSKRRKKKLTTYIVDSFEFTAAKVVGVDIETTQHAGPGTDADAFRDDIVTIQMSDGMDAWIVRNPDGFASIAPILESPDVTKIIHNSFFDLQFLEHKLQTKIAKLSLWDSLLAERSLNAGEPIDNGLKAVAARRCGVMLDKSLQQSFTGVRELSAEQLAYAANDVLYLPTIMKQQQDEINHMQLGRVVGLENRVAPIVARMGLRGVTFDPELWMEYKPQIQDVLIKLEQEVGELLVLPQQNTLFGETQLLVNLNSTKQMIQLFAELGIHLTKADKDGTKKATANKNAINDYIADHPDSPHILFLEKYMEWKKWGHTLSTDYAKYVNTADGLIHCYWNQFRADTGRFGSQDPNLQNVERPSANRPNLRAMFMAREGYVYIIADYSQQEPRIFAQMSGDEAMRKACLETDVYMAFSNQLDSHPSRQNTKTGVLAYLYGASPTTLANRMGIPVPEATAFAEDVGKKFMYAKRYAGRLCDAAISSGMTRTLMGRIRKYPEAKNKKISPHLLNQIVNAPVQGSGADMLKLAMDKFDDVVTENGYDAGPALVIHDEMVVEVREDQADEVYYQLVGAMEEAGRELCPDVITPVEGKISKRWTK